MTDDSQLTNYIISYKEKPFSYIWSAIKIWWLLRVVDSGGAAS